MTRKSASRAFRLWCVLSPIGSVFLLKNRKTSRSRAWRTPPPRIPYRPLPPGVTRAVVWRLDGDIFQRIPPLREGRGGLAEIRIQNAAHNRSSRLRPFARKLDHRGNGDLRVIRRGESHEPA